MADKLSVECVNEAEKFVNYMSSLLWDSEDVRKHLIDIPQITRDFKSGLKSLFLRFARPLAKSIVLPPLASSLRKSELNQIGDDMELFDNYYNGNNDGLKKGFRYYVKYGKALLDNPFVRKYFGLPVTVAGLALEAADSVAEMVSDDDYSSRTVPVPEKSESKEAVIEEVKKDLEIFKSYLVDAVFTGAGFKIYYLNELEQLREKFISEERHWNATANAELRSSNPLLMQELPDELKNQEFDVEISDCLRQLRIAIEDSKTFSF